MNKFEDNYDKFNLRIFKSNYFDENKTVKENLHSNTTTFYDFDNDSGINSLESSESSTPYIDSCEDNPLSNSKSNILNRYSLSTTNLRHADDKNKSIFVKLDTNKNQQSSLKSADFNGFNIFYKNTNSELSSNFQPSKSYNSLPPHFNKELNKQNEVKSTIFSAKSQTNLEKVNPSRYIKNNKISPFKVNLYASSDQIFNSNPSCSSLYTRNANYINSRYSKKAIKALKSSQIYSKSIQIENNFSKKVEHLNREFNNHNNPKNELKTEIKINPLIHIQTKKTLPNSSLPNRFKQYIKNLFFTSEDKKENLIKNSTIFYCKKFDNSDVETEITNEVKHSCISFSFNNDINSKHKLIPLNLTLIYLELNRLNDSSNVNNSLSIQDTILLSICKIEQCISLSNQFSQNLLEFPARTLTKHEFSRKHSLLLEATQDLIKSCQETIIHYDFKNKYNFYLQTTTKSFFNFCIALCIMIDMFSTLEVREILAKSSCKMAQSYIFIIKCSLIFHRSNHIISLSELRKFQIGMTNLLNTFNDFTFIIKQIDYSKITRMF